MTIVSVLGVIILLAAGSIGWHDIVNGILGVGHLQPYGIVILFFTLAYLCLSIDITGLFDFIALRCIQLTKGNGKYLFVMVFVLSTLLTLLTSNEIVILTLTKIILSLSKIMKIDPFPFLILEFYMANIWSAALFFGNPTNIIVTEANQLSSLEYSKWMTLPTVIGGFTAFFLIWLRFRKDIPETFNIPNLKPKDYLRDKFGSIFGSICLASCLITLLASPWIEPIPIWGIGLIFSGILFFRDIIYDLHYGRTIEYGEVFVDKDVFDFLKDKNYDNFETYENDPEEPPSLSLSSENPSITTRLFKRKKNEERKFFVTLTVLQRLPWKIIPFILSVFIIVEALTVAGWTNDIAIGLSMAIGSENEYNNVVRSTFLLGSLTSVSCNIMNNQPMTILFTRVIEDQNFTVSIKSDIGAMFGLILGSNFGANLSFVGSMAGIMWSAMLAERGYKLGFLKFLEFVVTIMPLVIIVSCAVLVAETALFDLF